MKRKLAHFTYMFGVASFAMLIIGCNDYSDYDDAIPSLTPRSLSISESNMEYGSEATTKKLTVSARNVDWLFSGMPEWFSVSPASGNSDCEVDASVTENASTTISRNCLVDFAAQNADYPYLLKISVSQSVAAPFVVVDESDMSLAADGETRTLSVKANFNYEVNSSASWLNVKKSDNAETLTIVAEYNPTVYSRSAWITISGMLTKKIKVIQTAAGMTTSQTDPLDVECEGGRFTLSLKSDAPWTTSCEDNSWISVTPSNGSVGKSDIVVDVAPNSSTSSRTGYVFFKIGSINTVELKIVQKGIYLEVSDNNVTFDADACGRVVNVKSNVEWKILSKPDWINSSIDKAKGDAALKLNANENNLTTARNGVVSIGVEGLSLKRDINVQQSGREFDNLVGTLQFDANPSSKSLSVVTDGNWAASADKAWITLSDAAGKGTADLNVSVSENTTNAEREGLVTVKVGNTEQNVLVSQKAHFLTIEPNSATAIPSTGGSHLIAIASDDDWTAATEAVWLTVSPTSGNGNIDIKVDAADNPSVKERKDSVIITPAYAIPVKAVILQKARYLNVNTSAIYLLYRGGESEPVEISTDGKYDISTTDSWITIKESGKTFTVTVPENTTEEKREGKVLIALTGLLDGESKVIEVPVVQYSQFLDPSKGDFTPDEDWNIVGDGTFELKVTGFEEDCDWNKLLE